MKLTGFSITNYRSIVKSEKIDLNQKTVIVGKNNEGKSNFLKAINVAFEILYNYSFRFRIMRKPTPIRRMDYDSQTHFDWNRDYPIDLQSSNSVDPTIFSLTFLLDERDKIELKKYIKQKDFNSIIFDINIHKNTAPSVEVYCKNKRKSKIVNNKENIIDYISNTINFVYIPAIRTENSSMRAIDSILYSRLSKLYEDDEYKKAEKIIFERQKKLLKSISKELEKSVKTFLPTIQEIDLNMLNIGRKSSLRNDIQFLVDDGKKTELAYKGDGFKSIITLALLHNLGKTANNCIVAIEEPESHLHSGAMYDLKNIIDKLTTNNQIILTTHNPIFIDRNNLMNNILVADGNITKINNLQNLRSVLGIKPSENLISCEKILLVEGETDKKIITHIMSQLNDEIKKILTNGTLQIVPTGGASSMRQYYDFYKSLLCDVVMILDNDSCADEVIKKLKNEGLTTNLFKIDFISNKETEIENIFKPYVTQDFCIKEKKFIHLDYYKFKKSKRKWSDEIKEQWNKSGLVDFDENIEKRFKYDFADYIVKNTSYHDVYDKNIKILQNIIDTLLIN